MWNLIRAEGRKLLTTRAPVALGGLAVLLPVLFITTAGLAGGSAGPDLGGDLALQRQLLVPNAAILGMILGVLAMGNEHRHGTIIPTVLAVPTRWPVLASKAIVVALAGVALTVLTAAAALGAGAVVINVQGGELLLGGEEIARIGALQALLTAGVTVIAAGVAAALRHQAVALMVVLVVAFVAGNVVSMIAPDVGWYLIPNNLSQALAYASPEAVFGRWAAAGILGGYVAAALAAGTALLTRRDIA